MKAEHHSRLLCGRSLEEIPRCVTCGLVFMTRIFPSADKIQNLRQVWFPGAHSNIGGGYEDQAMADITLAWMISQVRPFLDFTPGYILDENEETMEYYRSMDEEPPPWSFGMNHFRGFFYSFTWLIVYNRENHEIFDRGILSWG